MKKIQQFIRALAISLCLITSPALANDYGTALSAYLDGDHQTAFALFSTLAEQGDAGAQFNLGVMYEFGRGNLKNGREAFRWFKKAAEQGNALAQLSLSEQYADRGDYIKAHQWANIAQFTGGKSLSLLQTLEESMSQADISKAEKKARICLESGYTDCE